MWRVAVVTPLAPPRPKFTVPGRNQVVLERHQKHSERPKWFPSRTLAEQSAGVSATHRRRLIVET
jgi:hypothetical protein